MGRHPFRRPAPECDGGDRIRPFRARRRPGRRRAGVRAADRAPPAAAAPALLPDPRLAARRRRRATGDDASRLARHRPLPAASAARARGCTGSRPTSACACSSSEAASPAAAVDAHLEPYPDRLLDELPSPAAGPEETVEERERIGLAFVAAMQLLPPEAARDGRAARRPRLVGPRGRRAPRRHRAGRQQRAAARPRPAPARAARAQPRARARARRTPQRRSA